jgi:hypothetical protein
MATTLRKGIHFMFLLGIMIPLWACQPFGNSDDENEGEQTEQTEQQENKDDDDDENKSEKDD